MAPFTVVTALAVATQGRPLGSGSYQGPGAAPGSVGLETGGARLPCPHVPQEPVHLEGRGARGPSLPVRPP